MSLLRAVVYFNRDLLIELYGIIQHRNSLCCIFLLLKVNICDHIGCSMISEARIDLWAFNLDAADGAKPSKEGLNLEVLNSVGQVLHEEVGTAQWKLWDGLLELATHL